MKNKITINDRDYLLDDKTSEAIITIIKANSTSAKEPETFEECCKKFQYGYATGNDGNIYAMPKGSLLGGGYVPSEKRAKQLAAIAKMMTVADALNEPGVECLWAIRMSRGVMSGHHFYPYKSPVSDYYIEYIFLFQLFTSYEVTEKAIKILGEDVIKTAFGL